MIYLYEQFLFSSPLNIISFFPPRPKPVMKIPWKKSPKVAILFFLGSQCAKVRRRRPRFFLGPCSPASLPYPTPSLQQWEAFPHFQKMPLKTPLVSTLPVPKTNSRHQTHHHFLQERTHTHTHTHELYTYIHHSPKERRIKGTKLTNRKTQTYKLLSIHGKLWQKISCVSRGHLIQRNFCSA